MMNTIKLLNEFDDLLDEFPEFRDYFGDESDPKKIAQRAYIVCYEYITLYLFGENQKFEHDKFLSFSGQLFRIVDQL